MTLVKHFLINKNEKKKKAINKSIPMLVETTRVAQKQKGAFNE